MRTLRLVFVGGVISYRALFSWTTPSLFVGSLLAAPLFQTLFFVYLGRHTGVADDRFYVLGNAFLAATGACVLGGTMAVANERRYGTLEAVLLSTRSRLALWGGRALPYIANGVLVATVNLVASATLLGIDIPTSSYGRLFLALVTAVLSGSAFGIVIGAFGLRIRNTMLTANFANTLLILVTGADVPREDLPAWLAGLGDLLPMTHAVAAAREGVTSVPVRHLVPDLAGELLVGAGYAVLAALLLHVFERSSIRGSALTRV